MNQCEKYDKIGIVNYRRDTLASKYIFSSNSKHKKTEVKYMLIYAIVFISLALLFYTIAVFSERIQGALKLWHLSLFDLGFVCDVTGTLLMQNISRNSVGVTSASNLHELAGIIAIALMFIHIIWASVVLFKNNEVTKSRFHKFSIIVWIIWLIPFISGAVFHIN